MVKKISMDKIKSKYKWDGQNFYMHHSASSTQMQARDKAKRLKKKYKIKYRIIPARAKGYDEYRIFTSRQINKKKGK